MDKSAGELALESMNEAAWYNRWLSNKFNKYLKGEILEVGCGIGNFSDYLTKFGNVTCIDIEERFIENVLEKFKDKLMVGFGDIEKGRYFFGQKKFDTVVCLNVLEHISGDNQALKNLYRLLKPKGYLILAVPSHKRLFGNIDNSIGHFRRYDKKQLLKMIEENKFKILSIKKYNMLGALGWFVSGKMLKNKTISSRNIKIFNLLGRPYLWLEKFFEPALGISILAVARKR